MRHYDCSQPFPSTAVEASRIPHFPVVAVQTANLQYLSLREQKSTTASMQCTGTKQSGAKMPKSSFRNAGMEESLGLNTCRSMADQGNHAPISHTIYYN